MEQGKLHLQDFLPEEYLSWLGNRSVSPRTIKKTEIVLRFQPHVKVFGRILSISHDEEGRKPAPLLIRRGAVTYLKAPSGVGKTTIVKIIMGLIHSESMSLELGRDVYTEQTNRNMWAEKIWGRRMTMVFQHADEALNQNSKVKDVFNGLPIDRAMNEKIVVNYLSELFEGEPDHNFLDTKVKYLSGGQKQRLNLLRSLILQTDILILDEPLNGLDFASVAKVITMIEAKLESGIGVLVISHNEEIFDTLAASNDTYYLHSSNPN